MFSEKLLCFLNKIYYFFRGMDELNKYLQPGKTVAILKSSGVEKSTLVNALVQN